MLIADWLASKKHLWTIIAIVVTLLIILITIAIIIFLLFLHESPNSINIPHTYQITEINLSHNLSKQGLVRIPQILDHGNYISFFNEHTKSTYFVSNIGGSRYSCTGSCICTEPSRRAASSTYFLSRAVTVLITALSATMALKVAKEAFRNECEDRFSDSNCEDPFVLSYELDCDEVDFFDNPTPRVVEGKDHSKDPIKKVRFRCEGFCVEMEHDFQFLRQHVRGEDHEQEFFRVGRDKIGLCESLSLQKEIIITPLNPNDEDQWFEQGRYLFGVKTLTDFCSKASRLEEEWFSESFRRSMEKARMVGEGILESTPSLRDDVEKYLLNTPFCVGVNLGKIKKKDSGNQKVPSVMGPMGNLDCVYVEEYYEERELEVEDHVLDD